MHFLKSVLHELGAEVILTILIAFFSGAFFLMRKAFKNLLKDSVEKVLEKWLRDDWANSWNKVSGQLQQLFEEEIEKKQNQIDSFYQKLKKEEGTIENKINDIIRGEMRDYLNSIGREITEWRERSFGLKRVTEKTEQELENFCSSIQKKLEFLQGDEKVDIKELKSLLAEIKSNSGTRFKKIETLASETKEIVSSLSLQDEDLFFQKSKELLEDHHCEIRKMLPPEIFRPPLVDINEDLEFFDINFESRRLPLAKRSWRAISFYNYKGGVGKTTLAFRVAHDLAERHGKRVLLIDVDPQANMSYLALKLEKYLNSFWISSQVMKEFNLKPEETLNNGLRALVGSYSQYNDRVSIIPGRASQLNIEDSLVRWYCMGNDIRRIWIELFQASNNGGYDYIIFDCPPNMGFMSQAALAASDAVFVPVIPDDSEIPIVGVSRMKEAISQWRTQLGENGDIENAIQGIILNRLEWSGTQPTPFAEQELQNYREMFGDLLFPEQVPAMSMSITSPEPMSVRRRTTLSDNFLAALRSTSDTIIKRVNALEEKGN